MDLILMSIAILAIKITLTCTIIKELNAPKIDKVIILIILWIVTII